MSIADLMNSDRIIEVHSIITTNHTFKNGDTTFHHQVDSDGHYHIVSNDATKLISFNEKNELHPDCMLNGDLNKIYLVIEEQRLEIDMLKAYIAGMKEFINAFKETIYLQYINYQEYNYNKII